MLFDSKNSRQLGLGIGLSFQLVISVLLGLYLGSIVDDKMEMTPFGSLAGAIFGFIVGSVTLIRFYEKENDAL